MMTNDLIQHILHCNSAKKGLINYCILKPPEGLMQELTALALCFGDLD